MWYCSATIANIITFRFVYVTHMHARCPHLPTSSENMRKQCVKNFLEPGPTSEGSAGQVDKFVEQDLFITL